MPGEPQYTFYGYDSEPVASIEDGNIEVEWVYIGEGRLDNDDPDDDALLRFRIYRLDSGDREEIDNTSHCTNMPLYSDEYTIEESLWWLYDFFRECIETGDSLQRIAKELSWVSPEVFDEEWDEDDEVGVIDDD